MLTTLSFGQDASKEYQTLIDKADSLYNSKNYKSAAIVYSEAFKINGGKGTAGDRYSAACVWALAGYADSSFYYLNILASEDKFSYYSFLAVDNDLKSLRSDSRWKPLLETIKENKKTADGKWKINCKNNDLQSDEAMKKSKPEVQFYDLKVNIDVNSRKVEVEGYTDVDFRGHDSIVFILWKNTSIHDIKYKEQEVRYIFDTVSASPSMFIPNGKKLILLKPDNSPDKQKIYFNYESYMQNVSGWGKSFNDDWIEIGFYTAWYPVNLNSRNAFSNLQISITDGYRVSGSGFVKKNGNIWEMNHNWPIYDNVIIASKDLKSKKIQEGSAVIEIVYTTFPEVDLDSVISECKNVLNFYKKVYGIKDSAYVKFVICPVKGGGGYGRKNYISLKAGGFSDYLIKGIAHEMAHFWWNKANPDTWHDWLNEAFAEFSMLLYTKNKYGDIEYNNYIDAYRVDASNSCPIWGIDRDTPEAYTALYEKGSLILNDFEQKIGSERFFKFLSLVLHSKIETTNDFLDIVEKEISVDLRNWFESRLKAANLD